MIEFKVIVFFVCLSSCYSQQQNGNAQSNVINNNNMGTNQPFLPEQTGNALLYRPCPNFKLNCIRKYFAKNSKYCQVSKGIVPERLFRPESNILFSFFNLTVTQYGVDIFGLGNSRVTEFYVNEETDLVVLQIEFVGVNLNSTLDVYRYHRPGRFPAITKSNSRVQFSTFRTTTIFRGRNKLDLARSYTSGFIDATPAIYVNPTAGVHPDPIVQRAFALFVSMPSIVAEEAFLTAAPFYAATYIQCTICDYGLKVV